MKRHRHGRGFQGAGLIVGLIILALVLVFLYTLMHPVQNDDLVKESRPYYIVHVIGGMEEDVGHIIRKDVQTNE